MAAVTDSVTGRTTTYYYDFLDRMMKYVERGDSYSHSVGYEYDTINNLTKLVETINGTKLETSYTYDKDNRVTDIASGNATKHYDYDAFGRVNQQQTKQGETTVKTDSFAFTAPSATTTSSQVSQHTIDAAGYDKTYTYTYDDNGNILTISDGTNTTSYVYDSANQLIRENNQVGGYTHTWTYDAAGNILNRKEYAYTTGELGTPTDTISYTYGDTSWGDLLTAYDGQAITHDEIGNPLNDGTWTYTWRHGRQLASLSDGTTTWNFTYNADGIRTKRTNGTKTYNYVYNGDKLSQMTVGSDTLNFFYDASGTPMAVQYNATTYYYATNIQGDVIAILNDAGTAVVEYAYDAWGSLLSTTGTMATTLGETNPLRYRGYTFDPEYEFYYLQSRYYNPEIGRFICADTTDVLIDNDENFLLYNLYAYCYNNPINLTDQLGESPANIIGAIVGGAVGAVLGTLLAKELGLKGAKRAALIAAATIGGAVLGAFLGPYIAKLGSKVIAAAKTAGKKVAKAAGKAASKATKNIACFVAGTTILTNTGNVSIEKIKTGDWVFAEDPESGEKGLKQVVRTFANKTVELVHVFIEGEEIITTPEHPFYVSQKGWVAAIQLRTGDTLLLQNGEYIAIERTQHEILESPITVYNFEVAEYHTYYVGEKSVLVHNMCARITNVTKAQSKVWKSLKNAKNGLKKSGIGKNTKYYSWDKLHNEIEVFDRFGKHLGVMDPTTGEMIKGAVKGRFIKL